jgi:hypothetical protein
MNQWASLIALCTPAKRTVLSVSGARVQLPEKVVIFSRSDTMSLVAIFMKLANAFGNFGARKTRGGGGGVGLVNEHDVAFSGINTDLRYCGGALSCH